MTRLLLARSTGPPRGELFRSRELPLPAETGYAAPRASQAWWATGERVRRALPLQAPTSSVRYADGGVDVARLGGLAVETGLTVPSEAGTSLGGADGLQASGISMLHGTRCL
jgi:hypothetical protein